MKEGSRKEGEVTQWDSQRGRVRRTGTNHAVPQKVVGVVEGGGRGRWETVRPCSFAFISGMVCVFVDVLTFFPELFAS